MKPRGKLQQDILLLPFLVMREPLTFLRSSKVCYLCYSDFQREKFIEIDSGVNGWSFCQLEVY